MAEQYLIGIDSGTSGIKAVVFDVDGNELFSSRQKLESLTPHEDWYEEDMNDIWTSCCQRLENVLQKVDAKKVAGIGITAQGSP